MDNRIKVGITSIFRSHRRPIQLVVFFPVGQAGRQKKLRHPTEDVVRTTKDLKERTQLFEWADSGS